MFQTHVKSSDGGCSLVGLHHLSQSPHLLDTGRHSLRVWEALETDGRKDVKQRESRRANYQLNISVREIIFLSINLL